MTFALRFNGFYATGPLEWEEWHAGVRMHEVRYHYLRYYRNGDWIHCYRDQPFEFWAFTETVTPKLLTLAKQGRAPKIGDDDPLCKAGQYTLDGDTLQEFFIPLYAGGQVFKISRIIQEHGLIFGINDVPPIEAQFVMCAS